MQCLINKLKVIVKLIYNCSIPSNLVALYVNEPIIMTTYKKSFFSMSTCHVVCEMCHIGQKQIVIIFTDWPWHNVKH